MTAMLDSRQIEDIYPLTPTQRGMLFHTLYAPATAIYVQQETFALDGVLDERAFTQAWELIVARHAVLRTAIIWEGLDTPVQVVLRTFALPLTRLDWRDLPPAEQTLRLADITAADRQRGFDPSVAPLMRLTLIRLADEQTRLIWSRHHLLLDGWSVMLVLQ